VDFQEPDAWFHLRTAHNLLAHFPFRSGFDPYALFPGGMNMPTGPLWDYMIACAAWIVGFGSPSPDLTDHVAAWLPAILGALCPIPVFWVARSLFGVTAGLFAALWVAVTPGEFIWYTHLGNADHHAAEGFFSVLVFCFLCVALDRREPQSRGLWSLNALLPVLAGVSLGALLATQPAAIFVPGILVVAAVFEPSLARAILYVFGAAAVILLPVSGNPYIGYDWLSLGAGASAVAAIWLLELLHQRKGWPSWARWVAVVIAVVLVIGIAELLRPTLIPSLLSGIGDLNTSNVAELQPVIRASRALAKNIGEMNLRLGVIWIPALPGLLWIVIFAFRKRQPSLTLLALFSLAFTIAGFMHMRMILYFVPFAAILAGAVSAWLSRFATDLKYRMPLAAALAAVVLAFNVQPAIGRMTFKTAGAGRDWFEALTWLRLHSPEPFSDSAVWNGYYPRRKAGQRFPLPNPAYAIAIWWDTGYMVEHLSHRVPIANGFGAGIDEKGAETRARDMANFYASLFPEAAVNILRKLNARYVIVDSTIPAFPTMVGRSKLDAIQQTAGYDTENSYRVLWHDENGYRKPMFVYFADYYQAMGIRLFLTDGEAVHGTGPIVFQVQNDGAGHDVVTAARRFDSARAAGDFMARSRQNLMIGCVDPVVSCFDVPAVHGLHRVFTSDPSPISLRGTGEVNTVKIFEVEPVPPAGSR
jgi:dolichyl-diphosphooligosaccharide--protein glycosyltransferase